MSAKTKIIAIVAILATAGIAAFYFYRKGKGSAAYSDMLALGNQYLPTGFPQWLLDAAKNGKVNLVADYLVNGKATDYGKLLAAYDQQYFGYGYEYKSGKPAKNTGDEYALHEALWQRFYQEKNKA